MNKRHTLAALAIVLIAGAAYYFMPGGEVSAPVQNEVSNNDNGAPVPTGTCSDVQNSTFRSKAQYSVGNNPQGPIMGYWSVEFGENSFTWTQGDVLVEGTFSCPGGALRAESLGKPITINYVAGSLMWDGKEYVKID